MEAVDPGPRARAAEPGGAESGASGSGGAGYGVTGRAGSGAAGRRGRRRVVAPPTSGQSHEVESDFTDPFRADAFPPEDTKGRTNSGAGTPAPENSTAGMRKPGEAQPTQTQGAEKSAPQAPLTAHEQWILSQRPPHWG